MRNGGDGVSDPARPSEPARLPSSAQVEDLRRSLGEIRGSLGDVERDLAGLDRGTGDRQGPAPAGDAESPSDPDAGGRSRRTRLVLLVVGVLVLALAAGLVVLRVRGDGGATPAGVPNPGAALAGDIPGLTVSVSVGGDGQVAVEERLVLRRTSAEVVLDRPDLSAEPSVRLTVPTVRGLRTAADGAPVPLAPTATGWTVRGPGDGGGVGAVTARYRLDDAVARDAGTVGERALVVVVPLAAHTAREAGLPVQVEIDLGPPGARVLQVACPAVPADQQFCGAGDGDRRRALLPRNGTVPLVVFQVDLPPGD